MEQLTVTEYQGQRVLTTQQIADAYGSNADTITRNFNRNKDRYVLGKHYICLEGEDLRDFKTSGQIDLSLKINKLYLWTQKGALLHAKSLNTDQAWDVYERLVDSYFTVQNTVNKELSPNLQFMKSLVEDLERKELADRERDRKIQEVKETADKAVQIADNIREAVKPITDDWRNESVAKMRRIAQASGLAYKDVTWSLYKELELRAGVNLATRTNHKKDRMRENGRSKTDIDKVRLIDSIDEDKKLREIFTKILTEWEVRYCA